MPDPTQDGHEDPYIAADCATYLEHGACVCSTGYPASCTARGAAPEIGQPVLLDAFCCDGGATKGYQRAGFYVIGVDKDPHPDYCGDEFMQADAIEVLTGIAVLASIGKVRPYDAVHASPPCQFGTAYKRRPNHVRDSPNLIPQTRALLEAIGLPYVIENNYVNRRELIDPVTYCGSSFGLNVQRHRCFESNLTLVAPTCDHGWQTPRFPPATNRTNLRRTVEVGVWRIPLAVQREAMGIDWMGVKGLSQAIPPAYTEHIGLQLLAALELKEAA